MQIANATEQNLQMDLTFTRPDNQITQEIEEGLQGMWMKMTSEMFHVYKSFVDMCLVCCLCVRVCVLTVLGDVGQVGDDPVGLPLVRRGVSCERHG